MINLNISGEKDGVRGCKGIPCFLSFEDPFHRKCSWMELWEGGGGLHTKINFNPFNAKQFIINTTLQSAKPLGSGRNFFKL